MAILVFQDEWKKDILCHGNAWIQIFPGDKLYSLSLPFPKVIKRKTITVRNKLENGAAKIMWEMQAVSV